MNDASRVSIDRYKRLILPERASWRLPAIISVLLMEGSWLLAWMWLLSRESFIHQWPVLLITALLILAAAYLSSLTFQLLQLKSITRRMVMFSLFAVAYLWLVHLLFYAPQGHPLWLVFHEMNQAFLRASPFIPAELAVLVLAAYLCWRGVNLAMSWLDHRQVMRTLRLGTIAFFLIGVFITESVSIISLLFVAFLLTGLIAHAFARMGTLMYLRGGIQLPFNLPWLIAIQVSAVLLVSGSLLIGRQFADHLIVLVVALLQVLIFLVMLFGFILSIPFVALLLLLFPRIIELLEETLILRDMFSLIRPIYGRIGEFIFQMGGLLDDVFKRLPNLSLFYPYILWSIVLGVILAGSIWLGRKWGLKSPRKSVSVNGEQKGRIDPDLPAQRRHIQGQLVKSVGQLLSLASGRRWLRAVRIRTIYARLMTVCEKLGEGRREIDTPNEFLETLDRLFPYSREEAQIITDAYIRVRYGEYPEMRSEVERVEAAWRILRANAKDLQVIRKKGKAGFP